MHAYSFIQLGKRSQCLSGRKFNFKVHNFVLLVLLSSVFFEWLGHKSGFQMTLSQCHAPTWTYPSVLDAPIKSSGVQSLTKTELWRDV